ncbi:MAG: phosphotriesterase family protein [Acidobacteriota bacterium]
MTKKVRTLTGDVAPAALGRTLIHEHLNVDWGEMLGRPKLLDFDYDAMADRMVAKLQTAAEAGIGAMVECTPIGCGRYLDLFKDVAKRSPVKIICSTGFFHESWCPMHPIGRALDLDAMTDLFIREVTEGMGDTLIKAGMIKCATGEGRISENEERVLRAAARAHKATNCPIITHTTNGMGLEQLDIFESEGVKPEEVIVSHIGFEKDPLDYSERMLRRGANISFDRIGMKVFFDDEHWVRIVGNAIKKGYGRQTMISHDAAVRVYGLEIASGDRVFDDFTYIPRVFVPKLQAEAGVTDEQISIMLEENPQRVLAF